MMDNNLLLDIKDLKTSFFLDEGTVRALDGVDLVVRRGATLGVVGESGCGKSVLARSILQIVDPPGRVVQGQMLFYPSLGLQGDSCELNAPTNAIDLAALNPHGQEIRRIRGKEIAMVFQEPMTSLCPVHTIGKQITDILRLHMTVSKQEARARAIEMLGHVGIPRPEMRIDTYAFQLSGGMRQRAMIAMALSCRPSLLIADEPTTALDVTTQAQIMQLMKQLQQELGMAIMLITHDLGVVAEMADHVAIMYLGHVVEVGPVEDVFRDPKHPYTAALLRSIPRLGIKAVDRLESIHGMVPHPYNRPRGCPFHPRCERPIGNLCAEEVPQRVSIGAHRQVRCWHYSRHAEGA